MKQKSKKHIILITSIFLSLPGCSMFSDEEVKPAGLSTQQALKLEKLEKHIDEWEEISPSIKRLAAIEGELKELITELNAIVESEETDSTGNNIQAIHNSEPSTSNENNITNNNYIIDDSAENTNVSPLPSPIEKIHSDNPPQQAETETIIDNNSKDMFSIQLYSLSEKKLLRTTWEKLLKEHNNIFRNLTPYFQEVNVKGNYYYRLKAGLYKTKNLAINKCNMMLKESIKCYITNGSGEQL